MTDSEDSWIEEEVSGCEFKDRRLGRRFEKILIDLSRNVGSSMSVACQDWANTKAAYRFLSNERVSEQEILAGHFQSTRERFRVTEGPILVLHDTTEFSFERQDAAAIGVVNKLPFQTVFGCKAFTCGILMHSSLVVTTEGLPLGLGAIKLWTRDRFKGTNALKRKINPTRVPTDSWFGEYLAIDIRSKRSSSEIHLPQPWGKEMHIDFPICSSASFTNYGCIASTFRNCLRVCDQQSA